MTSYSATAGRILAGRYSIGEAIGRGGMGEVRSGWDKVLERPVAIKLLRENAASNPVVRRRFEAEGKAAARLVHPNIVQVYDSGEDAGIPFIVMEKLPGPSLREKIRTRRLSVDEATTLAVQVLAALDAAHRASLVHRDIKPANVLSAGPDHWKVADFGIAKSVQVSRADDTITGMVLGTPAYLPPERLLGGQAIPAGDVYALGVVVYEALAGRRPFEASDPSSWVAVAAAPPIPLRQLRPDVPAALAAAIERSISRDPSRRFADAGEMSEAITAPKSETSEGRTGWLAVPPAMPLSGDTEVLPRALNEHGRVSAIGVWSSERLRPRRIWFGGIGVGIAAMIALAVALAISAGPVRAHSPTSTTAVVQTTTTVPTTTLPAVVTPGPGHGHSNGDGGDKGGDSGGHGG